jgi:diadenosine tetraphosphate (Ap4A) HIT family hydrolase
MIADQHQGADCRICNLLYSVTSQHAADRVLVENDNYFAVASIGGFIPGWTLIFPKSHKLNLAYDFSNEDFLSFTSLVVEVVSATYGKCVIFEHGSNSYNSATSCGVNHAHLHVVPFEQNLELFAMQEQPNSYWKQSKITDISTISNNEEYLFCANSYLDRNTKGVVLKLASPQSQFFRRILAKATGISNLYDYKRYRFDDISIDTSENLREKFHSYFSSKSNA